MHIRYIDIHAHALPEYFSGEGVLEGVIACAVDEETAIINIGTNIDTSKQCIEVIEKFSHIHPFLYAIPGIHPDIVTEMYRLEMAEDGGNIDPDFKTIVEERIKNDLATLEDILETSKKTIYAQKIVGIGECGIDLYRIDDITTHSTPERDFKNEIFLLQRELFKGQIELALKNDVPIMIHARESYAEILSILDENFMGDKAKLRGNIHFFAGTPDEAKMFLERGFTVSFTGVITFAKVYEDVVRQIPMDKVLSETDSPFVSPVPMRGKTCEPSFVRYTVEKMAQIKGVELELCRIALLDNADKLFKLGLKDIGVK